MQRTIEYGRCKVVLTKLANESFVLFVSCSVLEDIHAISWTFPFQIPNALKTDVESLAVVRCKQLLSYILAQKSDVDNGKVGC